MAKQKSPKTPEAAVPRKWTIAIRPTEAEGLRKITKIIGLNGGGFSVLTPYHKSKSGFIAKAPMDLFTLGARFFRWEEGINFTAEDRVKLSYHTDGFAQFSGENQGKIVSGRDEKTGEPKGIGLYTRALATPPVSGPSVGVVVWGIDQFEKAEETDNLLIFDPSDFYYRNCEPEEANLWTLSIYAFGSKSGIPPLKRESKTWRMLYQPHPITAGIQGTVIEMKVIHLKADGVYLGLYVERAVGQFPVPSGWILSGPGNYTQYQKGHALVAVYPRAPIPTKGSTPLDYNAQIHAPSHANKKNTVQQSRSRVKQSLALK